MITGQSGIFNNLQILNLIPMIKNIVTCIFSLITINSMVAGDLSAADVSIIDSRHYSNVFGEIRNFRIFLPPGYNDNPEKRYPVIYYYHGWSQRYFGSTSAGGVDKGDDNDGDNIANYVAEHDVIVVKPDGYNRETGDDYYLRPYNVAPVETSRQFPLYFPELVSHIDLNYRTLDDREHRAISGLSMGGFMSFWIGGKYPDLLCAIGNFCGSTEFTIGPKEFPVEYRHIDMYNNYAGVNVRLNYGNQDFIRYYHRDMNRIWTRVMDNYQFGIYNAAHSTCGLSEMFDFIMKTFENPVPKPEKWNHTDVYPEFSLWGYKISSDRDRPGFTILQNVDKRGFRCSVRQFLPDGTLMLHVSLSLTTPPIYEKNTEYIIKDFDVENNRLSDYPVRSDSEGRLTVYFNGATHEIGINKTADSPNICVASYSTDNLPVAGKEILMSINLVNKGNAPGESVTVTLSPFRSSSEVSGGKADYGTMPSRNVAGSKKSFRIKIYPDTIEIEKFRVDISDRKGNLWSEFIEIPLVKDLPEITNIEIADGRTVTVAAGGDKTETIILGSGNGDGKANPGESIVILVSDRDKTGKDKLWRTFLKTADTNININGISIRKSDSWGSYDHVGGSAKYSVPLISSDCKENKVIDFFAEYWLPDYPDHIIKQGKVKITVSGADRTPPEMIWMNIRGDNVIQACINDGSEVRNVKARLTLKDAPEKSFEVALNDKGIDGDSASDDNVFSYAIPEMKFGLYNVEVEATDMSGNSMKSNSDKVFVLH